MRELRDKGNTVLIVEHKPEVISIADHVVDMSPGAGHRGGERQRLKLANELGRSGQIYVLDEPTTGLHMADVATLLRLLDRLVDGGSTVIVIEHNLDVVACADWVIDLGPGAGHEGGRIVFEGPPSALAACAASRTGRYLARRG